MVRTFFSTRNFVLDFKSLVKVWQSDSFVLTTLFVLYSWLRYRLFFYFKFAISCFFKIFDFCSKVSFDIFFYVFLSVCLKVRLLLFCCYYCFNFYKVQWKRILSRNFRFWHKNRNYSRNNLSSIECCEINSNVYHDENNSAWI